MKRPLLKALLFGLACLVTLIALFYAEENWRGRRAWQNYKHQLEARGERLDPSALIPPKVPDEQNFAMTPLLSPLFDFLPGTQQWRDTNALGRVNSFAKPFSEAFGALDTEKAARSNSWAKAHLDFSAWYAAFQKSANNRKSDTNAHADLSPDQAASAVLEALSQCDPALDELRAASRRPYSRFNIRYEEPNPAAILLPHLAPLKNVCRVLQLRASAELALGRTDDALIDLNLIFYLIGSLRDDPTLIAHLVRIAQFELALQSIYDGLASHRWSDPQIRTLQEQLQRLDFCAGAKRALETERAFFGGALIDYLRRSPRKYQTFLAISGPNESQPTGPDLTAACMAAAPSGWFYLEQLNYHRMFQDFLFPTIDVANHRVHPSLCRDADAKISVALNGRWSVLFLEHRSLSAMLLPALSKVVQRSAFAQAGAGTAALACALERHRLAKGHLPDSLDGLIPQFIDKVPTDVITGQPLKYHRAEDGRFLLYSVGWNEADDNGTLALNKSGTRIERDKGDWVWQ